jgi:hypothetical protein
MKRSHFSAVIFAFALSVGVLAGPTFVPVAQAQSPVGSLAAGAPGKQAAASVVLSDSVPVELQKGEDPIAPEAFAISDGVVYLADQVHQTVRTYSGGVYRSSLSLGDTAVADLRVSGSVLTALEPSGKVRTFSLTGPSTATELSTAKVPLASNSSVSKAMLNSASASVPDSAFIPDARATHLRSFDGRLITQVDDGSQYDVSTSTVSPLAASSAGVEHFQVRDHGFAVLNSAGAVVKTITVANTPGDIESLYRGGGYDYYLASSSYVTSSSAWIVRSYVFKFTTSGTPVGVYTLVTTDSPAPGSDVQIVNGQVFQLVIDKGAAKVLQLSPDTGATTVAATTVGAVVADTTSAAAGVTFAPANKSKKPKKLPLIDTLFQSVRMAHLPWTFHEATNGNKAQVHGKVRQPRYLKKVAAGKGMATATVTGYPYTWGGYDSLNTTSKAGKKGWKNFVSGAKKGKYTGNTTSANGSWVSNTVGLDCSGLVSAVFRIGHKDNTETLVDNHHFKYVKPTKTGLPIQRGDILIRPGEHVEIVLYVLDGGRQLVIGESTNTVVESDRVMHWTKTAKSFQVDKGWKLARYQNWNKKG